MKATNHFTRTILTYLELRAETDSLFAESFANKDKSIDECIVFILNQVQKSGCMGFADEEIYNIAIDYYTSDVEVGKPINARICINHVVELTQEEKEQAKQDAIQKAMNEASKTMIRVKKRPTINKSESTKQLSLF